MVTFRSQTGGRRVQTEKRPRLERSYWPKWACNCLGSKRGQVCLFFSTVLVVCVSAQTVNWRELLCVKISIITREINRLAPTVYGLTLHKQNLFECDNENKVVADNYNAGADGGERNSDDGVLFHPPPSRKYLVKK